MFRRQPDHKLEMLRTVPIFARLDRKQLEHIERIADEIQSQPGEALVRQGELGRELIVIVDGSLRVEQGGQKIAEVHTGDVVGEMALLDGEPRSATVITETPSTLLIVPKRSFDDLLATVPGLQRQLLLALCARLRQRESTLLS